MSLVLIRLGITIQTKALTLEGYLDFQMNLFKQNLSMLGEEVRN